MFLKFSELVFTFVFLVIFLICFFYFISLLISVANFYF